MLAVTFADIQAAADILRGIIHVTPVLTSRQLNEACGASVYLKCENFQRIGAFKIRGAYHAVARVAADCARHGRAVVTLSSGNHAQGIALACQLTGLPAHIVMQVPVNPVKRAAVEGYGAVIHEAPDGNSAERELAECLEKHNGHYVHAFDDPAVIAGQGTCALEFVTAVSELDVLMAPVGGGGLLSGTSVAAHRLNPSIEIYACEPAGALDAKLSVEQNRIVPMLAPRTIAEGLRTSVGKLTLPILREHLAGFFVVEEHEIIEAMRFVFERMKIVIEPSSAVALAPLLRRERALLGRKVGVILTGGNVELSPLFSALADGL